VSESSSQLSIQRVLNNHPEIADSTGQLKVNAYICIRAATVQTSGLRTKLQQGLAGAAVCQCSSDLTSASSRLSSTSTGTTCTQTRIHTKHELGQNLNVWHVLTTYTHDCKKKANDVLKSGCSQAVHCRSSRLQAVPNQGRCKPQHCVQAACHQKALQQLRTEQGSLHSKPPSLSGPTCSTKCLFMRADTSLPRALAAASAAVADPPAATPAI
jgi:hypothetical protein